MVHDVIFERPLYGSIIEAQVIRHWGYPCETHTVHTTDGYRLPMHRIPHAINSSQSLSRSKPAILLIHGLEGSSADWVINLPHQSAGFVFADAEFDVWLANCRGNEYSSHERFSKSDDEFWDFSWQDMADYDLPAIINKVIEVTNKSQIYYIANSQGNTMAFYKFSYDYQLASKIRHFFAFGPIHTIGNVGGPILPLVPTIGKLLKMKAYLTGYGKFVTTTSILHKLGIKVCTRNFDRYCANVLAKVVGPDHKQLNKTRIRLYLSHFPSGTSTKNIIHYAKMIKTDEFRNFDGSVIYNISRMRVPVGLFWGGNDYVASQTDVKRIIRELNIKAIGMGEGSSAFFNDIIFERPHTSIEVTIFVDEDSYFFPNYNHMDFVWGMNAGTMVYSRIISKINKIESRTDLT